MKTILKITVLTISLVLMLIADLPFLPVQLVPEAAIPAHLSSSVVIAIY